MGDQFPLKTSSQRDHPTIARRFNAGSSPTAAKVPQGRLNGRQTVSAIAMIVR